ncbi:MULTISPECIES: DUF6301 family protein [Nocardia]|uniref:DUF6301 family protein n=1 Tax=Nocardia TaxID=1817 RepID=UPI000D6979D2|nr:MULTISPECIES: DUF6301 family protein [Nocardia]
MTVDVDVDSARAAILSAAEFDWTWSTDNVQRFCEQRGWRIKRELEYGFEVETGFTGPGICMAFSDGKGVVNHIDFTISAKVEPDDMDGMAELSTALEHLTDELKPVLGNPVDRTITDSGIRIQINLPQVEIFLSLTSGVVWVNFTSPAYQRQQEEWDRQLAMGPP